MKRIGMTALAAMAIAGCTKQDPGRMNAEPVALWSVEAGREAPQWRGSNAFDPRTATVVDRQDAGHVLRVTIDGFTEKYRLSDGCFRPVGNPVVFRGEELSRVDFRLCGEDDNPDNQDGSAAKFLDADVVSASGMFDPSESLSGIVLTHERSLIEVSFADGVDVSQVGRVRIGAGTACPVDDVFLCVIAPGLAGFEITLEYGGVDGYSISVSADSVTADDKEIAPNHRYRIQLGVDKVDLSLALQMIGIASWSDAATVAANTP